jgi:hypothetical protein
VQSIVRLLSQRVPLRREIYVVKKNKKRRRRREEEQKKDVGWV